MNFDKWRLCLKTCNLFSNFDWLKFDLSKLILFNSNFVFWIKIYCISYNLITCQVAQSHVCQKSTLSDQSEWTSKILIFKILFRIDYDPRVLKTTFYKLKDFEKKYGPTGIRTHKNFNSNLYTGCALIFAHVTSHQQNVEN